MKTIYALTQVLLWCLFPSLLHNSGIKHQSNPQVNIWALESINYSNFIYICNMIRFIKPYIHTKAGRTSNWDLNKMVIILHMISMDAFCWKKKFCVLDQASQEFVAKGPMDNQHWFG